MGRLEKTAGAKCACGHRPRAHRGANCGGRCTATGCECKAFERGEVTPREEGCSVCGATPVVDKVGLCGPCCFGEADTAGGNW